MDPIIGGALINTIGGLFGRKKSMSPGKQIQSHVTGAMLAAKDWGLNPLTVLGIPPMAHQQGDNAFLGQAIIDSGMMLMDKLATKKREAETVNRLASANRRLQSTVEQLTLRPPVPGVYARRAAVPSRAQAMGVDVASQPPQIGPPPDVLRPIPDVDVADPRREVEVKPVPSGPGVMAVDNPYFPKMWFPTIDGDEPLDVLDLPSFAFAVPQLGWHGGAHLANAGGVIDRPKWTKETWEAEVRKRKRPEVKLKPPPMREFWTHPQTGFSAVRR